MSLYEQTDLESSSEWSDGLEKPRAPQPLLLPPPNKVALNWAQRPAAITTTKLFLFLFLLHGAEQGLTR